MSATSESLDFIKAVPFARDPSLQVYVPLFHPTIITILFNSPWASVALFRDLSEDARNIVARLLFVKSPIPKAVIANWFTNNASRSDSPADSLSSLFLLKEEQLPGGLSGWILNPYFQRSLRVALLGGSNSLESLIPLTEQDPKVKDTRFIDEYASQRWDCVLQYIVNPNFQVGISKATLITLLSSNLMVLSGNGKPIITNLGIQFLLFDTRAQVWFFILNYLIKHCGSVVTFGICLKLLIQIAQSTPGMIYTTEGFTGLQLAFLQDLREFGFVYQRTRKEGKFYPTKYILCLLDKSITLHTPTCDGRIITESNFRIIIYSQSNYLIYLASLFATIVYRFPEMAVATLTRESLRSALKRGIKAKQITDFLHSRMHPCMKGDFPSVVADQLALWEQEMSRINAVLSILYRNIHSDSDFVALKAYAEKQKAIIWFCERTRRVVVTLEGHWKIKKYWKHQFRKAP